MGLFTVSLKNLIDYCMTIMDDMSKEGFHLFTASKVSFFLASEGFDT